MKIIRKINLDALGITRAYVMFGSAARKWVAVVKFGFKAGYFSNFIGLFRLKT
jgi:hypothetical protein